MKNRLKTILSTRNLQRKDLSSICDVAYSQVTRWINGETYPSVESLIKINKKLNINLHWLLTGEGDSESRPVPRVAESLLQYCSRRDFEPEFVKVLEQLEGDVKKQVRAITLLEIFVTKKFKESEVAVLVGDRSAVHEHDP